MLKKMSWLMFKDTEFPQPEETACFHVPPCFKLGKKMLDVSDFPESTLYYKDLVSIMRALQFVVSPQGKSRPFLFYLQIKYWENSLESFKFNSSIF
jgi:hypothetical protein